MWPLKTILCSMMLSSAWVGALINPIWGVVSYLMVYQIYPSRQWWGKPLVDLGVRFSLYCTMAIAISLIVARRNLPKLRPMWSPWEFGVAMLVVIGIGNIFLGVHYDLWSQVVFNKFWKMMLFVLVLVRVTANRTNLRIVVWTFVAGSLWLGYDAYTAPEWEFVHGRLNQVGGPDFGTSSGLAAHMGAMLPLIGAALLMAKDWRWRVLAIASAVLTVNTIVLCRTRSAFIGLAVAAGVALLSAPRARRYRIYFTLIIGALGAYHLTDGGFWERMNTLTDREALVKEDPAARTRLEVWKIATHILADHPFGVGVGNFPRVVGQYDHRYNKRASHNTLVLCFVELGIHGGVVFVLIVLGSVRYLQQCSALAAQSGNPIESKLLTYGLLVSLISYFATGLGTERLYCESYWWSLAMPLCLYRVLRQEAHERAMGLVPALATEEGTELEPVRKGHGSRRRSTHHRPRLAYA